MIKKTIVMSFLFCIIAAFTAEVASAEIKFDYGANFRLRQEYWEKIISMGITGAPDRDFFRLRSQVWGKADVNNDLGVYLRLNNEAKYYIGNFKPQLGSDKSNLDNIDMDELIIDNLYLDYRNVFGVPLDVRIGRQDFLGQYGEGFLIMEGTPVDGSRTFYFNALKATVRISKDTSVDAVYVANPVTDQYLPSLYPARPDPPFLYQGNKKLLNLSFEEAYWLYGRSKLNDNISVEPYYIYKIEDALLGNGRLKLNTLGARAVFTAARGWRVRGEFAHQFGKYDDFATTMDRKRVADGGYIFGGRKYENVALKPEWELGYVYLSGDDPNSADKNEGFDPLFSRNPNWNELYVYVLPNDTGKDFTAPGYWTNLHLFDIGLKLTLPADTNLALAYQFLRADEATNQPTSKVLSNSGKDRGQLGSLTLTKNFTKQISGLLLLEYFIPGNFYVSGAKDEIFARWQMNFRF